MALNKEKVAYSLTNPVQIEHTLQQTLGYSIHCSGIAGFDYC